MSTPCSRTCTHPGCNREGAPFSTGSALNKHHRDGKCTGGPCPGAELCGSKYCREERNRLLREDLLCICKQPYVEGEEMVQCGACEGWYHPRCVGADIDELEGEDYICAACQPGPSQASGGSKRPVSSPLSSPSKRSREEQRPAPESGVATGKHKRTLGAVEKALLRARWDAGQREKQLGRELLPEVYRIRDEVTVINERMDVLRPTAQAGGVRAIERHNALHATRAALIHRVDGICQRLRAAREETRRAESNLSLYRAALKEEAETADARSRGG